MPAGIGQVGARRSAVLSQAEMLAGGNGFTPGTTIRGEDGWEYIFLTAAGAIAAAGTATANLTTFVATAGAGTYIAQAAMVAGDRGWFRTATAQISANPTSVIDHPGARVTPAP